MPFRPPPELLHTTLASLSHRTPPRSPKFIYLINADEMDPKSIPQDAFVVYQGHHGDVGAQLPEVNHPGFDFGSHQGTGAT